MIMMEGASLSNREVHMVHWTPAASATTLTRLWGSGKTSHSGCVLLLAISWSQLLNMNK
jgi:hypothetical protein